MLTVPCFAGRQTRPEQQDIKSGLAPSAVHIHCAHVAFVMTVVHRQLIGPATCDMAYWKTASAFDLEQANHDAQICVLHPIISTLTAPSHVS